MVAFVHRETGGALPVIGVGGILDPDDAARMFDAGAGLVQLYTGFIYRRAGAGPRDRARPRGDRRGRPGRTRDAGGGPGASTGQHVWHPYAPMPATTPPYVVESAHGVRLRLADGRELVDGMSSLVGGDPRLPAPGAGRRASPTSWAG